KGVKRYTIDHPQHPVVALHSTAAAPPMTTYQVKRASDSKIHEVTGEFHVEVEWLEKFVLSKKRPKISFGSKIGAEISGLSWQDSLEKYAEWPAKPDIEKRLFEALERGGENALPHRQLFEELKKIKEKIEIVYSYLLEALQKIQEIDRCRDTLTKRLLLTESARLLGRVFETDEYRFYLRIRDLHWREVMNYFYLYWKRGQRMEEKERFVSIAKALLKSVAAEWISIAKMLNGGLLLGKTFKGEPAVRARAPDPEGTHYADGSYYSDERVSDGVRSIYYPSGKLKAEISFRMGRLDGTVQLYFPDGTIKRSIGFKEGKKEGVERAFATDGTLLLEATFREDMPVGKAFYCDVRDGIGLKASFDEEGKVLEVEEW
ncbi:MAG: hypothetical protein KDK48_03470, partial [Chlamydiia bacterium]|nr:hypothetical protein [Chlamydiia bacterium]